MSTRRKPPGPPHLFRVFTRRNFLFFFLLISGILFGVYFISCISRDQSESITQALFEDVIDLQGNTVEGHRLLHDIPGGGGNLDILGNIGHGDDGNVLPAAHNGGWREKLGQVMDFIIGPEVREKSECLGWDPEKNPSEDPVGCLKARQYRQVQGAIERESMAHHLSYQITYEHNMASLKDMIHCFLPVSNPKFKLCPERPVVLSEYPYTASVWNKDTTGEVIWQESLVKQIHALGYYVLASGPYGLWVQFADMIPDVYEVLWAQDLIVITCISDPRCIAPEHYVPPPGSVDRSIDVPQDELGTIPIWRLNVIDYWGSRPLDIANVDWYWNRKEYGSWSYHPLGQQWQATPWALPDGHFHLPYSIEEYCLKLPVRPHDERDDSVLIYAKLSRYFHRPDTPPTLWSDLAKEPSFKLITTAEVDEFGNSIPDGLESIGGQDRIAYEKLVGSVKAVLGIGFPSISPSVYTALCQATPVIVPHFQETYSLDGWDKFNTNNLQHGPAMTLGEPYVYTYWLQNATELKDVIHRAMNTPIDRFIPGDMTLTYALAQMKKYLTRDLEGMYRSVLEKNGGRMPHLHPGIYERCRELKRCYAFIEAGRKKVAPREFRP